MGFLDSLKGKFSSSHKKVRDEELNGYLRASRDNLKLASEQISKFFESLRDFQPARRHEELYREEVKNRLAGMRSGISKGLIFLDERMNNSINTMNTIKNAEQLRDMVVAWMKTIKADDEKVYDVIKILQVEMWGQDKISRGFPVPTSKDMTIGYLNSAVNYLTEARNQLDTYVAITNVPEA